MTKQRDRLERTALDTLMRILADGGPHPELTVQSAQRIGKVAEVHGVAGVIYGKLHAAYPSDLLTPLEGSYRECVRGQMRGMAALERVSTLLNGAGIPWLAFKGPVLASFYRPGEFRQFSDLDIAVERSAFREAVELIERAGGRVLDENWPLITAEQRGQLHLRLGTGEPLDLHWHIVNRASVRRDFGISMAELLSRRRTLDLGGVSVPVMDSIDALVHVALHAALGGGHRLQWLVDLARVAESTSPVWDLVIERAASWSASEPVGLVFARTRRIFATAIPVDVTLAMLGRRTRHLLSKLLEVAFDPLNPTAHATVTSIWTQGQRHGATRTATALARAAMRRLHRSRRGVYQLPSGEEQSGRDGFFTTIESLSGE